MSTMTSSTVLSGVVSTMTLAVIVLLSISAMIESGGRLVQMKSIKRDCDTPRYGRKRLDPSRLICTRDSVPKVRHHDSKAKSAASDRHNCGDFLGIQLLQAVANTLGSKP